MKKNKNQKLNGIKSNVKRSLPSEKQMEAEMQKYLDDLNTPEFKKKMHDAFMDLFLYGEYRIHIDTGNDA